MTNQQIFQIIIALLLGVLTAYLAMRRGRNPVAWFVIGSLLGIFGLLILFLVPSFETAGTGEEKKKEPSRTVDVIPQEKRKVEELPYEEWYYLDSEHKQTGPVPFRSFRDLWNQEKINSTTYVWKEGMENWKYVRDLPDLLSKLS